MENRVVIEHGNNPARQAYQALNKVFTHQAQGKKVLLKPNLGRIGEPKSGLCTHPEVIRGLIKFFQDQGAKDIYVGDGALVGVDVWLAAESSGILEVCRETGATFLNLDEEEVKEISIPNPVVVDKLKITSFLDKVDLIVSVPVMKTHMYTKVTLSIKNMKGCLYRKEKTKLHTLNKEVPDKSKGLVLDYGIADMARVLKPHYAVIDGIVGMEGFGPSVGTSKALDVVIASEDPLAADLVALELMGMAIDAVPHLNLINEQRKLSEPLEIATEPSDFIKYRKNFKPASLDQLNRQLNNIEIVEKGSCSACSAAVMLFAKNYNNKLPDCRSWVLATGKELNSEDLDKDCTVFIGNCTAKTAKTLGANFCSGCPPVGSNIFNHIQEKQ